MKITIFTAGSRGDIQPCIVLGIGLQQAGYQIRLAAPENFKGFVEQHGLEFYPLRGDVQQIMASDTGRSFMQTGGANPIKSIRAMRSMIAPIVMTMVNDLHKACLDSDALICLGVFSAFGQSLSEGLNMPMIQIEPTPLLPTRAFPAPSWPVQKDLGSWHNSLSGVAMLNVIWLWYQPFVNQFRQQLGLKKTSFTQLLHNLKSTPMLSAYSPTIIPHPPDGPESLHISGYLFLDDHTSWQPAPELLAFLDAGNPPVYFGFGSMAGNNPEHLTSMILEALSMSGQRGLLLTGWGGLHTADLPDHVFVLDSAPHSWLFPRMAAVVHHGGAGTTAEGLRAGIPSIITPFVFDQYFWGARIKALGLGPAPIPQKKLTAQRLASAIQLAVSDPGIRQRAKSTGESIRAEDGAANAVKLVETYFGHPAASKREK